MLPNLPLFLGELWLCLPFCWKPDEKIPAGVKQEGKEWQEALLQVLPVGGLWGTQANRFIMSLQNPGAVQVKLLTVAVIVNSYILQSNDLPILRKEFSTPFLPHTTGVQTGMVSTYAPSLTYRAVA